MCESEYFKYDGYFTKRKGVRSMFVFVALRPLTFTLYLSLSLFFYIVHSSHPLNKLSKN